jgi:hypothetical protein
MMPKIIAALSSFEGMTEEKVLELIKQVSCRPFRLLCCEDEPGAVHTRAATGGGGGLARWLARSFLRSVQNE